MSKICNSLFAAVKWMFESLVGPFEITLDDEAEQALNPKPLTDE